MTISKEATSNETLALTLLVDATADSARSAGEAARQRRAEAKRREAQQATEARNREIQRVRAARSYQISEAYASARRRLAVLAPLCLFLCFQILLNNFMDNPFAEGSYAVTIATFILIVAGCLGVDVRIGRGRTAWLVVGAVIGFVISLSYTLYRDTIPGAPMDVSMFWLTGFVGVCAYLVSARRTTQSNRRHG